jgi:hypothetical protein
MCEYEHCAGSGSVDGTVETKDESNTTDSEDLTCKVRDNLVMLVLSKMGYCLYLSCELM